jgi:iron complex transport system ATP-binding protein
MTPLLNAERVAYEAKGRRLVDGVSIGLRRGEVLAVVGPNGAGKTTLVKLLAGDVRPSDGRVLLDGRDVRTLAAAELARLRAVLPQQTVLQFAFTAEEVVAFGRAPHRRRFERLRSDDWESVGRALLAADAQRFASRAYPTLSVGEQTRVDLARVLAQDTPILLLDEPTASLDIRHQELVLGLARELATEGRAVAVVLHDLNLAASHADRVAVLDRGRLVVCASPWQALTPAIVEDVFRHPVVVCPHPRRDCPLIVV